MPLGVQGLGQMLAQRQQLQGRQQGLPPGIDPRAVAANPQGFARQQAMLQRAGGDPRRAAMMQMLQGRLGQRQRAGGQQGALGRMLARRQQAGGQQQGHSPLRALMRRRAGRTAVGKRRLQQRLAQRS